jgi:hypothetical protein
MSFMGRLLGLQRPAPVRRASREAGANRGAARQQRREPFLAPSQAFTPTRPRPGRRQLVGRQAELQRILQALQEDRAHIVLYSERGRGKTSLSNMVVEALRRTGTIVARHTCEAGSDFDSIVRGLMRDLPSSLLAAPDRAGYGEGCEGALPDRELRPMDAVSLPSRLVCRTLVCVIDEFDRVEDARARTRLADAIKQISDRDADLQFMIVGVSANLDEILGQHPSIQRSVLGIHLPLFTHRDVAQMIAKGAGETGFTFPPTAIARVTALARGMPYMAQLLGLRLTQAAAARGDTAVSEDDFDNAVAQLVRDANPRVVGLYAWLTDHGRDSAMVMALRRVATAPQDPWGRMELILAHDGGASLSGRHIPAECWERLEAAQILQTCGLGSGLFAFAERSLMHHALLLAPNEIAIPDASILDDSGPGVELRAPMRLTIPLRA